MAKGKVISADTPFESGAMATFMRQMLSEGDPSTNMRGLRANQLDRLISSLYMREGLKKGAGQRLQGYNPLDAKSELKKMANVMGARRGGTIEKSARFLPKRMNLAKLVKALRKRSVLDILRAMYTSPS